LPSVTPTDISFAFSDYDKCITQPIAHFIYSPYKPPDTFVAAQTNLHSVCW
jgi:hypothetical protein